MFKEKHSSGFFLILLMQLTRTNHENITNLCLPAITLIMVQGWYHDRKKT
jgi:hypothetical protein